MKRLMEKMVFWGLVTACRLAAGADEAFAVLGEGDDRGGGAVAFRVGDDGRLAAFHYGDARVGRAEVDSDHFTHASASAGSGDSGPSADASAAAWASHFFSSSVFSALSDMTVLPILPALPGDPG
jgi:hypothetical protein